MSEKHSGVGQWGDMWGVGGWAQIWQLCRIQVLVYRLLGSGHLDSDRSIEAYPGKEKTEWCTECSTSKSACLLQHDLGLCCSSLLSNHHYKLQYCSNCLLQNWAHCFLYNCVCLQGQRLQCSFLRKQSEFSTQCTSFIPRHPHQYMEGGPGAFLLAAGFTVHALCAFQNQARI